MELGEFGVEITLVDSCWHNLGSMGGGKVHAQRHSANEQAFISRWDDWDDHPNGKLISSQGPLPLG